METTQYKLKPLENGKNTPKIHKILRQCAELYVTYPNTPNISNL